MKIWQQYRYHIMNVEEFYTSICIKFSFFLKKGSRAEPTIIFFIYKFVLLLSLNFNFPLRKWNVDRSERNHCCKFSEKSGNSGGRPGRR